MKRKQRTPLLVLSSSFLATSAIGYGSWVIYKPDTVINGIGIPKTSGQKVCYIGDTYYTSIGRAIEESKSGDTIVVIPGNKDKKAENYVITPTKQENIATNSLTIPSGVTLSLPYKEGASNTKKPQDNGLGKGCTINMKDASGNFTYLTSCAWVNDSITLVNNGTIEIGGVLGSYGGGNPTGGTSGNFSALFLGDGATLKNNGTMNVYGLLGETKKNNGSSLICEPAPGQTKAYLNIPFYWYDFCGGSTLKGIYDQIDSKKCLPVDDFFFNNITPSAAFKKGAIVTSWVNLNAASSYGEYDLTLIDDGGSGILTIQDGAYVIADYDEDTLISSLDLYGKVSLNEFKIDVKSAIKDGVGGLAGEIAWAAASAIGVPSQVTSASGYFPVSYHWNVTMNKNQDGVGEFDGSKGRFKLLNGASLKVAEGASFKVLELIGYNGEDYYTGRNNFCTVLHKSKSMNVVPSKIVVNGNVSGDLVAATIFSESAGATIVVTSSTNATTYEPKAGEGEKKSAKMYDGEQGWFYIYPKLKLKNETGSFAEINQTTQNVKYVSMANEDGVFWTESKDILKVTISSKDGYKTESKTQKAFKLSATISPEGYTSKIIGYKWHVSLSNDDSDGGAGFDSDTSESPTLTIPANSTNSDITYKVYLEITYISSGAGKQVSVKSDEISFTAVGGCFASGTPFLMADGSYKNIEDIKMGDRIITWNFFAHKFEPQSVAILVDHGERDYVVASLIFSNGKGLDIIAEHGLFDYDLNEFIYLTPNNSKQYLHHRFVSYEDGKQKIVELVSSKVTTKRTHAFSITSAFNYNAIANGILSAPPPGLFYNWVKMSDKMQYDVATFEKDVKRYGLYDYSAFEPYGISYEVFVAFNGKYLKIPVEKGIFSFEYIIDLFNTYKEWLS